MKKLLLLPSLIVVLSACGTASTPKSVPLPGAKPSITGTWEVVLSNKEQQTLKGTAVLTQNNATAEGDFTGVFTTPVYEGSLPMAGNRSTGKFTAADTSGNSIACNGLFAAATYNGACILNIKGAASYDLTIVMTKP